MVWKGYTLWGQRDCAFLIVPTSKIRDGQDRSGQDRTETALVPRSETRSIARGRHLSDPAGKPIPKYQVLKDVTPVSPFWLWWMTSRSMSHCSVLLVSSQVGDRRGGVSDTSRSSRSSGSVENGGRRQQDATAVMRAPFRLLHRSTGDASRARGKG